MYLNFSYLTLLKKINDLYEVKSPKEVKWFRNFDN